MTCKLRNCCFVANEQIHCKAPNGICMDQSTPSPATEKRAVNLDHGLSCIMEKFAKYAGEEFKGKESLAKHGGTRCDDQYAFHGMPVLFNDRFDSKCRIGQFNLEVGTFSPFQRALHHLLCCPDQAASRSRYADLVDRSELTPAGAQEAGRNRLPGHVLNPLFPVDRENTPFVHAVLAIGIIGGDA